MTGQEWWVSAPDDPDFFGDYSHVVADRLTPDGKIDWADVTARDPSDMDAPVVLVASRMVEVERVEIAWPPMTPCGRCGGDGCADDDIDGCGPSGGNGWRHPLAVIEVHTRNRIAQTESMIRLSSGPTKWRDAPDIEARERGERRLAELRTLHASVIERMVAGLDEDDQ